MKLVIMRHGQAEQFAPTDSLRGLTEKGRSDVQAVSAELLSILYPSSSTASEQCSTAAPVTESCRDLALFLSLIHI